MGADTSDAEDETEDADELSVRRPSHLTITGRRDFEMDTIGWGIFLIMIIILLPLLPIIVLIAAISKLLGFGHPRAVSWG